MTWSRWSALAVAAWALLLWGFIAYRSAGPRLHPSQQVAPSAPR